MDNDYLNKTTVGIGTANCSTGTVDISSARMINSSGPSYITASAYASNAISGTSKITGIIECNGPGADVILNGVSLKTAITKIQERLLILVPDPALLSKYESLQVAYEQYKLLEALCQDSENK